MIIGITGNAASGKTTVARLIKKHLKGLFIDADRITDDLYIPKSPVWQKTVRAFGKDILNPNQTIKRKVLAEIVFNNPKKLKKLEEITHPYIIKDIKKKVNTLKKKAPQTPIIIEAIKILDGNLNKIVDKVVLVTSKKEDQINRLLAKDHSMAEALARIDAYKAPDKHPKIVWTITNEKGLKALENAVKKEIGVLIDSAS